MSYNQGPKNVGKTLYLFFGVVVSVSACSAGAKFGGDDLGIGALFILAILVLYWGAPIFIETYKEKREAKITREYYAKRALERKSTYRPESQKAEAPKDQNKPQPSSASSQIHAPQQVPSVDTVTKEKTPTPSVVVEHEKVKSTGINSSKQIHLIDCPACGHKVSNYAHACPNCGHPIADTPQVAAPSTPAPAPAIPTPKSATPRCPTCGSTDIKKLDSLDRTVSTAVWGIASGKIGKQFKCKHCGYMW